MDERRATGSTPVGEAGWQDGAESLRRQARTLARTLVRPGAYLGLAREVALGAFCVATYPLGIRPADAPEPVAYEPRTLTNRHRLSGDPEALWTPVVLVHGYIHNRSAFLSMSRTLRRAGFRSIHALNYNPLTASIPELAQRLGREVETLREATGAERVQIVGHSMGGIVARSYVQEFGGAATVDTVITLGAPHRGTHAAHLGIGPAGRQLRPGSPFMRRLEETARPSDVRWVSYYSDLDALVIPAASGKLVHPALRATNFRVRDTGHLSLLLDGEITDGVIAHLSDRRLNRSRTATRQTGGAAAG